MTQTSTADVVVIGGGPAGSAAATMLARQGWSVILLERERFPRDHVGESLLPASIPILEELGVLPAVEAQGFVKKLGATMVWGRDREPWSWFFGETNRRYPHSYQVWRPTFDHLLLDNAAVHGVDVRQGWRAAEVMLDSQNRHSAGNRHPGLPDSQESSGECPWATTVRCIDDDGKERHLPARFVVDASGQNSLLGRQLGLRQWDESFRNLAVYAYYEGAERTATAVRQQHLHRVLHPGLALEHSPAYRAGQRWRGGGPAGGGKGGRAVGAGTVPGRTTGAGALHFRYAGQSGASHRSLHCQGLVVCLQEYRRAAITCWPGMLPAS